VQIGEPNSAERLIRRITALFVTKMKAIVLPKLAVAILVFREICREALRKQPAKFSSLEEALSEVGKRLRLPMGKWINCSHLIGYRKEQYALERFLEGGSRLRA